MQKIKYVIKIPGLTLEEQTDFIFSNLKENLHRLRLTVITFFFIEFVMVILLHIPGLIVMEGGQFKYYIYLYIIVSILLLLILFLSLMGKHLQQKNIGFYRISIIITLMLVLICSVFLILFGYNGSFLPNTYLLLLIAIAVIPFFNMLEIILIIAPAQFILTVYVFLLKPFNNNITLSLIVTSWSFVFIALVISFLFYQLRIRSFKNDIQLVKQNNLLKQHSEIDALTNIYNRRKLDEVVADEWRRSSRSGKFFSFLLIDLDYFKKYNDTYGHIEGDICLRKTATIMKNTLKRSSDLIFRYGGEEFAVVLPLTTMKSAEIIAERLRKNIENAKFNHYSSLNKHITISIGIASSRGDKTDDFSTVYTEADKALYAAKRSGRNKVIAYDG